jgi:hypothetical protein
MQGFDANQFAEIRRILIMAVLATDMSKHFMFLKEFQNLIEKRGQEPAVRGEHNLTTLSLHI